MQFHPLAASLTAAGVITAVAFAGSNAPQANSCDAHPRGLPAEPEVSIIADGEPWSIFDTAIAGSFDLDALAAGKGTLPGKAVSESVSTDAEIEADPEIEVGVETEKGLAIPRTRPDHGGNEGDLPAKGTPPDDTKDPKNHTGKNHELVEVDANLEADAEAGEDSPQKDHSKDIGDVEVEADTEVEVVDVLEVEVDVSAEVEAETGGVDVEGDVDTEAESDDDEADIDLGVIEIDLGG